MSVAQLRATAHFDVNHRSESCLNACVLNIDKYNTLRLHMRIILPIERKEFLFYR